MKIAFFCASDFNLGAAYLIAYLKKIGHEVRLFLDPYPSKYGRCHIPVLLKKYPPGLVCFSCVTANYGWALRMADQIKTTLMPNVKIIFGGVHPTLCPEDFKGYDICQGDGLAYFGGKFEPDELWPDREIFFEQLPPVHRAYQIFMTGFGCPFRCSFCNTHQLNKKITRRSAENCIEELSYLKERGLRYVLFDDDIFTINKNWLNDFLNLYQRHVKLPFTCFGHAKYINSEIATMLKSANCQCVWLGVQSGSETTRKDILNRTETNKEIKEACDIIKANGLKLMIDHIFGLPFDNIDKLAKSYHFYKTLKPDVVNVYELLYLPKAEINKYGSSKALYQKQGGDDYKRYARSFASIPLINN